MDDEFFGRGFGIGRRGFGDFGGGGESFFFNDFNRVFKEMDDMMRNFGLGHFSMIEGPNQKVPPAIEAPPPGKHNLRDRFLKDSPANSEKEKNTSSFIFPSNHNQIDRIGAPSIFDEDLDVKIEREGLEKVLREDLFRHPPPAAFHHHQHHPHHQHHNHHHHHNPHNSFFHPHPFHQIPVETPKYFGAAGQAYSVKRIQRPDGSIEETKTVRNSDGQEEKTVTRIIGDKAHSVIEKKVNNQLQETEEIFHNFDEDKIDEFNRMWKNFSSSSPSTNKEKVQQPPLALKSGKDEKPTSENNNFNTVKADKSPSIFSKLFSWFKK